MLGDRSYGTLVRERRGIRRGGLRMKPDVLVLATFDVRLPVLGLCIEPLSVHI